MAKATKKAAAKKSSRKQTLTGTPSKEKNKPEQIPPVDSVILDNGLTDDAKEHPIPPIEIETPEPELIPEPEPEVIEPEPAVDKDFEAPVDEIIEPEPEPEPEETIVEGFKPRNPLTGIFNKEEREYVDIHLQARIAAGITRDANHFVRQCINFCVNYQIGWQFGRADVPRKNFE